MARSPHHIRNRLTTGCALLLLAIGPASAQGGAGPQTGEILTSGSPDKIDLRPVNKSINDWRAAEHERLRKEGRATAEEFRKIDAQAIEKARSAEIHRSRALEELTKNVNASASERARAAKAHGNERLDEILEKGAKIEIKQGAGGTEPVKGRGTLGDIDTDSFHPKDFDRIEDELKRREIPYTKKGDALTIDTLDVTIHRKSAGETILESGRPHVSDLPPKTASSEQLGSSGYATETARGNNPETAMGLGRNDPAVSVADNLKKAAHTLDKPLDPSELQKLGKMTVRNIDETAKVGATGKAVAEIDPITRKQAEQLKAGYSPEGAGIVRDHATPEQRAADLADFQRRAKAAAIDAVRAGDAHIVGELDRLAGEVRHANDVLRAVEETGDLSRIAKAKSAVLEADKAMLGYIDLRDAAHNSAILNDHDAANIYAEARGVKPEGKSPSEIREEIVAGDRKTVADAVAEPTKAPAPGETPKAPGTGEPRKPPTAGDAVKAPAPGETPKAPGAADAPKPSTTGDAVKSPAVAEPPKAAGPIEAPKPGRGPTMAEPSPVPHAPKAPPEGPGLAGKLSSGLFKGVNIALGAVMIYEGVKRGAEEAGKDAAEHGDGMVKSTAKTIGYSAWYGLGVGGAVEAVGKAGGESMEQYKKDIKEGKVDPKSFGPFVWSQVRAVGWGLADLTGAQAIKDAAVEGAGLYSDRAAAAKAEKAAEDAEKAAADKAAIDKTVKATIDKAAGAAGQTAGAATVGTAAPAVPPTQPSGGGKSPIVDTSKTATAPPQTPMLPQTPAPSGAPAPPMTAAPTASPVGAPTGLSSALPSKQTGTLPPVPSTGSPAPGAATVAAPSGLPSALPSKQAGTLPSGRPSGSPPIQPPTSPTGAQPAPPVGGTPATPPQVTQPSATPPKPTTTEVDGGWMTSKDGRSKVVYINDANGNRIGGYVIHYDPQGREIGRVPWTENPTPSTAAGPIEGTYVGTAAFSHLRPKDVGPKGEKVVVPLRFDVRGGRLQGSMVVEYQKPWPAVVEIEIAGTVSNDGAIAATVRGKSRHSRATETPGLMTGATDYPFLGTNGFSGQIAGGQGRGTFTADGQRHDSVTLAFKKPIVRCETGSRECAGWIAGTWSAGRR